MYILVIWDPSPGLINYEATQNQVRLNRVSFYYWCSQRKEVSHSGQEQKGQGTKTARGTTVPNPSRTEELRSVSPGRAQGHWETHVSCTTAHALT